MRKAHLLICSLALPILATPAMAASAARGKYLVESIGICQDCHTPRGPDGQLDKTKWLKDAPIDFKPEHPMPGYRFNARDAKAVADYLKTLP